MKIKRIEVKEKKKPKTKRLCKKELEILEMANNTRMPDYYKTIWTKEDLDELCDWIKENDIIAVDTETLGLNNFRDSIVGISFYAPNQGYYIPLLHQDDITRNDDKYKEFQDKGGEEGCLTLGRDYIQCLKMKYVARKLKPLLEDGSNTYFVLHNLKFDAHVLKNWMNINIPFQYDTMVAQALLDENKSKSLKALAAEYLNIPADSFSKLFGKITFDKVPLLMNGDRTGDIASFYAIKDTEITYKLYEFQMKYLPKLPTINKLMFDLEMPFLEVVFMAEQQGVKLDEDYIINKVKKQLEDELANLRDSIGEYLGKIAVDPKDDGLNLNSPKQVSQVLFNDLGLDKIDGDSVSAKVLNKLKHKHQVIPLIIDYKKKAKLTQAFTDKLVASSVEGRLHTSFHTTGTKTGRLSCSNPNLQQIPSRVGGLIRNAFVADEGRLLASIDFSQQELRVLTHISRDRVLMDIYRNNKDVHSMTALTIYNTKNSGSELTYEQFEYYRGLLDNYLDRDGNVIEDKLDSKVTMDDINLGFTVNKYRKMAKVVNFGVIYGMGKYGLADTLEISVDEAEQYIQDYFNTYPGVKYWIYEEKKKIAKSGYALTLLKRKRRVYPELNAEEKWKYYKGLRMGINAEIQGSSADMVKLASIKLRPLLKELDVKILLWVHDEIIFDVPENIGMDNLKRISDVMCNALPLSCGLKSDIEVGYKWAQKMSEDEVDELNIAKDLIDGCEKGNYGKVDISEEDFIATITDLSNKFKSEVNIYDEFYKYVESNTELNIFISRILDYLGLYKKHKDIIYDKMNIKLDSQLLELYKLI